MKTNSVLPLITEFYISRLKINHMLKAMSVHLFSSLAQMQTLMKLYKKSTHQCQHTVKFFFFLCMFLGNQRFIFRNFFLCCPSQRSARSQVPSLGGNPPGDWQSAVGWGDAEFEPGTAGQQPGALPLSYHASLML
jgi:hypothetical protein